MLLNLPDEILEKIFDYLDRNSLKKVIRAHHSFLRFERRWMKTHLKKVYTVKDGTSKWITKYSEINL